MSKVHTFDLALQTLYLRIGIGDNLVELAAEMTILVGQVFAHRLIVQSADGYDADLIRMSWEVHFLRCLIGPKSKPSSSTFHDRGWVQATQHACFVVFGRLQDGRDSIVWVG